MSTSIVLAGLPYLPPKPPLQPGWEKTQIIWEGGDGSSWDLTDYEGGVFLVKSGIRGLGDTTIEHKRDARVGVPGAYHRTVQYGPREVHWALYVYHDGSTKEFVERVDAFWASLDPEREGTMRVRIPGVRERSVRLRYGGDGNPDIDLDPAFFGWVMYSLDLQADQPFFMGDVIEQSWDSEAEVDFFGTDPDVIYIGSGQSIETAEITNPGDQDSYALITFYGDFTSASVTINGRLIEVPFSMDVDELLVLNTDPIAYTAVDGTGANRYSDLGQVEWPTIPARTTVPVDIVITGGSGNAHVDLVLLPLYRRAL